MRALARDPFVHFVVLGALIWGGLSYLRSDDERFTIHIGTQQRQRIAFTYEQQFGQAPAPAVMSELIDRYVREEIMEREALALRLDAEDEIVRRRLIQKYEFLQTSLESADPPGEVELRDWFRRNERRYVLPALATFSHVYFPADGSRESFPGPLEVSAASASDLRRLFGQSEVVDEILAAPVGEWCGPFRSGYGWHLIRVVVRTAPVLPAFEEIRPRVLADYEEDRQQRLDARAFQRVRERYVVRYEGV